MLRIVQITLICLVFAAGIWISAANDEKESIYEILKANELPVGIFPKGVTEFNFDSTSGRFSVFLKHSCDAKYETELHYETNITGTIKPYQILDLSGISAQELFLWFPVKGIRVDDPTSGVIFFDVGVVRKQYSLSLFETSRDCVAVPAVNKVQSSILSMYEMDQTLERDIL